MNAVTIIAEAGVNHNGRLDLALELVDAAAEAGADIVKFQTFRADQLVTQSAAKADYQIRNTGEASSQLEMLKTLELDGAAHRQLITHCDKRGVEFLSTPFDPLSLALLVDGLGMKRLKVGSGDLTNAPILLEMARRGCAVILSTGMATMEEIEEFSGFWRSATRKAVSPAVWHSVQHLPTRRAGPRCGKTWCCCIARQTIPRYLGRST